MHQHTRVCLCEPDIGKKAYRLEEDMLLQAVPFLWSVLNSLEYIARSEVNVGFGRLKSGLQTIESLFLQLLLLLLQLPDSGVGLLASQFQSAANHTHSKKLSILAKYKRNNKLQSNLCRCKQSNTPTC